MAPFWWGRRRSSSHGLWNDHRAEAERDDGADGGQGGGPPREAHVDVDVAHVEPELVVFARKPRARELWYRPHREVDMSAGLRRPSSNEEPASSTANVNRSRLAPSSSICVRISRSTPSKA